ncbi:MAG: hypothetical protein Q7U04_00135 [Bacteriovorax sp.]|nr:hypothetical protein [Bacteriovorax sp.]
MKKWLSRLTLVLVFFALSVFSLNAERVNAVTCTGDRDMYADASCGLSEGLGGSFSIGVGSNAACNALCDGTCHASGCPGSYCAFQYVNCTY